MTSFGKETDDLYTLPALTSLDLSYNTIEEIDDASLVLLYLLTYSSILHHNEDFVRHLDN